MGEYKLPFAGSTSRAMTTAHSAMSPEEIQFLYADGDGQFNT